jgi:hypothetical protein
MAAIRWLGILIAGICLLPPASYSGTVSLFESVEKPQNYLMLEGEIAPGDADRILSNIEWSKVDKRVVLSITIRSPGGDVLEALKIAEILNKNLIEVETPWRPSEAWDKKTRKTVMLPHLCVKLRRSDMANCVCNSACALVWLSAPLKDDNDYAYIGIHRPRFSENYFAGLGAVQAQEKYTEMAKTVSSFLAENEVPPEIITKMMSVPSSDIYYLTREETQLAGEGKPYLLELLDAKCSNYRAEHDRMLQLENELKKPDHSPEVQDEYLWFMTEGQYVNCIWEQRILLQRAAQGLE